METQKADNQMNLAVELTPQERERSLDLDVGFDERERTWEIIVKYSGNLERLRSDQIQITPLSGQYAIVVLPQNLLDEFAREPEVEFIEKPKRLHFAILQGKAASCIGAVQSSNLNLTGRGILVGIVDSGVDYAHEDFRRTDGTSRILRLWDQTIPGGSPEGYNIGSLYTQEDINEALQASSNAERYSIVPSRDLSGHGTGVAGIAAGNGRESNGVYRGIAYESELVVVKLGASQPDSFPRTTQLMQAIDYCVRFAASRNQPLALNISFGNSYGSHVPYY
jgi:minor extracellular serine protease Vpr